MTTATTTATTVAAPRPRVTTPWLLIVPSLVFMLLLFGWPLVQGILAAFRSEGAFTLDNWARMFADPYFSRALRNTLLLTVIVVPVQLVLAVGMALLLQSRPRFAGTHFYLWAIPLALSELAAGLVWLAIFSPRGYLNSFISWLGLGDGIGWLDYDNATGMLFAVVIAEVWRATSLVFVILVAGLQMVPRDYDEAAQVFGASAWQRLWHVTLPSIRPSLQVALVLRTILAIQVFAVAQALTGRNFPLLVGETYQWYVNLQNAAVASALALVVLGISLVVSIVYLRTLRGQDHTPERGGAR
ncbi:carbohydrate ABC transporter permease [Actinophytocola sp.]|uniref:carbohydrate ABC transporter permease n=1 Tax=Actinophytocola sp. TaxID=1872138 RepID=UPI003D6AB2D3